MFKGKGKALIAGLALTVAIPLVAFAAETPDVNQYTAKEFWGKPEMTEELREKKEELRRNFANGEFKGKMPGMRGGMPHRIPEGMSHRIPEELKTTIEALHNQVVNNEITQEEAREQIHGLMQKFKEIKLQESKN